jgi:hypothetical protein
MIVSSSLWPARLIMNPQGTKTTLPFLSCLRSFLLSFRRRGGAGDRENVRRLRTKESKNFLPSFLLRFLPSAVPAVRRYRNSGDSILISVLIRASPRACSSRRFQMQDMALNAFFISVSNASARSSTYPIVAIRGLGGKGDRKKGRTEEGKKEGTGQLGLMIFDG